MIDSNLPRFAQALQALVLALAFVVDAAWVVPLLAVVLLAAVVGGPRWNLFAHVYRALPLPRGEPEPAAPPRFAQGLGAIFLGTGALVLALAEPDSAAYWWGGWGPAVVVAVLAAVAATTTF